MMEIIFFFIMVTKHFIVDFAYQPPYMWQNKGTYGHLGGILHSGLHALVTFAILLGFTSFPMALGLSLLEFIIHYHVDWFKMSYNKSRGWGPTTHEEYWVLLGVDQYLHYVTYIIIAVALFV